MKRLTAIFLGMFLLGCGGANTQDDPPGGGDTDAGAEASIGAGGSAGAGAGGGGASAGAGGSTAGSGTEWSWHTGQIDPNESHSGQPSLKLEVGEGCGDQVSARSASFKNLSPNQTYVVSYWYRYADCAGVQLQVAAHGPGDSTYDPVPLQGTQSGWVERSFEFFVADNPTGWGVDVSLTRFGTCANFQGPKYQNNFVWIDDVSVKPRPN